MSVLTLAKAKTHLNITWSTDDVELQDMIDAAESVLGDRVGPLTPVSRTERVDGYSDSLVLFGRPVAALTSVTSIYGNVIPLTDLHLESTSGGRGVGVITYALVNRCFIESAYDVVYQHGWATVPNSLLEAIKDTVRHLWETQRAPSRRPGERANSSAPVEDSDMQVAASAYLLSYRIEGELMPHKPVLIA